MSAWIANNLERPGDDALYGKGHRPRAVRANGWWPACECSQLCRRADDHYEIAQPYPSDVDAREAAATNLREHEHGPSAGRTA